MPPVSSPSSDHFDLNGARGADVLGLSPDALVASVRAGLPTEAFERLRELLGVPARELSGALSISERTLVRRREKGRLTPQESDRLLRLARLAELTLAVFEGDREGARAWLTEPKTLLGGEPPVERADTEAGAREVEDMLYALEFGFAA
jgi:putative toxin-antitoxin system antitoxin component (TIGR02293 family)